MVENDNKNINKNECNENNVNNDINTNHDRNLNFDDKEIRPITYVSKFKVMLSNIKIQNIHNLSISTKVFQTLKSFKAVFKSAKTIKSLKSIKFSNLGYTSFFRRSKNIISKTHEINHSTEKITSTFFFNFLNKVALTYVLVDSLIKGYKNLNHGYTASLVVFSDSLLWHFLASSFIPGIIIHIQKHFLNHIFHKFSHSKFTENSKILMKINSNSSYVIAFFCLISIPFYIEYVDELVDLLLDNSIRKFYFFKMNNYNH